MQNVFCRGVQLHNLVKDLIIGESDMRNLTPFFNYLFSISFFIYANFNFSAKSILYL